ncbi:DUF6134 family protein [Sneathiella sp. HT1-7]|jgi:hypothetical protein|uniref:DUF6134 family protein n=1 Tax=Sneathiella sp. HT1-7 TaxID=2887192 RepID=UPI001D14EC51|nr:DUF6134 family protein [Sneathiella sp. HT1-7]MCC3305313.1 DUF6134 family protein [Sneathiella sp. HT1-7]
MTDGKYIRRFRHAFFDLRVLLLLMMMIGIHGAAASSDRAVDPLSLYGERHEFSVHRDGVPVGKHMVSFERVGDAYRVDSELNIEVKFLGISLYRFDYESEAIWSEGKLTAIDIRINDDGTNSKIRGMRHVAAFVVNGEVHATTSHPEVYPTNHWHKGVLDQSRLFNTLTGKMNNVTITDTGEETVPVRGGTVRATRYVYDGELTLMSWYDRKGRWVKMAFKAEDNSDMVYFCETCPVEVGLNE